MALGPYCKELGIDEEVLNGDKSVTCDVKNFTNGIAWELRKHKTAKKLPLKELVDWIIKLCGLTCENEPIQKDINIKLEKLANLRAMFVKSSKSYPGEIDRLMKWQFDFPESTGVEPAPVFEPIVRANLGPKLLKVLKEKGADDDDSMDVSGPDDDDDELAKRRKSREELVQLKKDLMAAKKTIVALNERLNDLNKVCSLLSDMSKSSVSECRRTEVNILRLTEEWNAVILTWHDTIERLNHVNNNKGNYLDVGYMVRRNKTKQGIFDELNFEFERTVDEFKHKINSILEKERRKKKPVSREYRQKGRGDRKRVAQDNNDDAEESKKPCLPEDVQPKPVPLGMPVEEFMKSEKVEEFMGGKFVNALKAIYVDLTTMPIPCQDVHEVIFSVLSNLEGLNVEKIPSQSFAGNILMEARMLAMLKAFSHLMKINKTSICNDANTSFSLMDSSYSVTLSDETKLLLGVRDISEGSPDTSLNFLKDVFGDLINIKAEGNKALENLAKTIKSSVIDQHLLEKKIIEIVFLYKQQILPKLKPFVGTLTESQQTKICALNNFCASLYFHFGLSKLVDVTILAWELMSQNMASSETNFPVDSGCILSKTLQQVYLFCQAVDPLETDDIGQKFNSFITQEKKLEAVPLAPYISNLFNVVFHNTAGLWFYYETGFAGEFLEKLKETEVQPSAPFECINDKHTMAVAHALGLIGKLVAVPVWTALEDYNIDIDERYSTLLKKVELWSKDASQFMKGQDHLFDDIPVSHDAVYISLIKNNEAYDALTKELLELIFTSFVPYIKCFLYGGTMNGETNLEPNSDLKMAIHKDHVIFDRITKSIHSLPTFSLDALMLYSKTRNGEWQDKLCSKNNLKIFELISKSSNKQLKSLYKRKIKLSEIQEQAREEKEEFGRCQLIEKRYKLIDDIVKWGGLWKSEKELEERLKDMKEIDQLNALKAQVRFRRHVLCETHENGLLDLAFDGECFNSQKLSENLKSVLRGECQLTETDVFELASATDDEELKVKIFESCKNAVEVSDDGNLGKNYALKENFYWLLGKLVSHTFMKGGNMESLSGVCIARKKVEGMYFYFMRYKGTDDIYKFSECKIANDYKNQKLRVVDPPKDIIGSRLSRAFFKDDGDLEWHDCHVIEMIGPIPEFVVEFDFYGSNLPVAEEVPEVEALTFTSRLLEDYKTGRLRFL